MYAMGAPVPPHHHQGTDGTTEKKKKKEEKDREKHEKEKDKVRYCSVKQEICLGVKSPTWLNHLPYETFVCILLGSKLGLKLFIESFKICLHVEEKWMNV